MRKEYKQPKAVLVEYRYDMNVVAKSATCSGSIWRWQEPTGCSELKFTDSPKTRSAHPCDWASDDPRFSTT